MTRQWGPSPAARTDPPAREGGAVAPLRLLVQEGRARAALRQVVLVGFDGRIGRPDYGDKDDRDAGVNLPKLLQHVQPRLVGQTQVQHNDIRLHCGGAAKTFGAGGETSTRCSGDGNPWAI